MSKKILFVLGTRPEAVKTAPLINTFKKSDNFITKVCITGQHKEMTDNILNFFGITPDYNLNLMTKGQTLFDITVKALTGTGNIIDITQPDLIFVQGDTTSVFAASLAAFYKNVKTAHIEAGLRTGNKYFPFPEEINRILTGHIADFHFAPTPKAKENLKAEGIEKNVFVTGNSVIDALFEALKIIKETKEDIFFDKFKYLNFDKKIILLTAHRRENFGEPFENICKAVKNIAENNDVQIIYPVHPNPNIKNTAYKLLSDTENIFLVEPLPYPELVWLMDKSYLVLTDSGGIQEEAPSLGKPVLVLRNETERTEGVEAGTVKLTGTNTELIIKETSNLLNDKVSYKNMKQKINPYGNGTTSQQILDIITKNINEI
ncbi:MAG: UDP-N-acetylglucosamine 2-epimerase (non-hydrolyzing) [Chlorobi bacterium]|nr:UDP-N-acetylglucosamine 2-epimerase (non-hydrolyzing) [Chlorobiota bacterium]